MQREFVLSNTMLILTIQQLSFSCNLFIAMKYVSERIFPAPNILKLLIKVFNGIYYLAMYDYFMFHVI